MITTVVIGLCDVCGQLRRAPSFSYPPADPTCACDNKPEPPRVVSTFDRDVQCALDAFRVDCEHDDMRDTLLRLHSFAAMAAAAHSNDDAKSFIAALISLSAVAKLLSESVEESNEPDQAADAKAGCDP